MAHQGPLPSPALPHQRTWRASSQPPPWAFFRFGGSFGRFGSISRLGFSRPTPVASDRLCAVSKLLACRYYQEASRHGQPSPGLPNAASRGKRGVRDGGDVPSGRAACQPHGVSIPYRVATPRKLPDEHNMWAVCMTEEGNTYGHGVMADHPCSRSTDCWQEGCGIELAESRPHQDKL